MTKARTDDFTLRPFDPQRDAQRLREIIGEIWGGGDDALLEKEFGLIGGRPWADWLSDTILAYLQAEGTRGFVAEQEGQVIGFCSYVIDQARKRGTVGYNGVARSHQGREIGSAMLDFVMSRFRAEGMDHAVVIVGDNEEHLPARRNYEKHGFRRLTGYHYMVQKL